MTRASAGAAVAAATSSEAPNPLASPRSRQHRRQWTHSNFDGSKEVRLHRSPVAPALVAEGNEEEEEEKEEAAAEEDEKEAEQEEEEEEKKESKTAASRSRRPSAAAKAAAAPAPAPVKKSREQRKLFTAPEEEEEADEKEEQEEEEEMGGGAMEMDEPEQQPQQQAEEEEEEQEEEEDEEADAFAQEWLAMSQSLKPAAPAAAAAAASSSSYLKPRPAAASSSAAAAAAAASSSSRGIASSSNLDTQFTPRAAGGGLAASDPAAVPHGFIQRGGVLHLSSSAEAAATARDTSAHPSNVVAPDLLAALGGKSSALASTNPLAAAKAAKSASGAQPNAGKDWFNLSRPSAITPEIKADLKLLSLRAYMDPKKFFKKSSANSRKKIVPTFFQMGTVIAGAQDFYSSRLSHAQRSDHFADEFVNPSKNVGAVKKTKNYLKRKIMEVQTANTPAPKTGNKKKKMMQEASKRPGASGKKKH